MCADLTRRGYEVLGFERGKLDICNGEKVERALAEFDPWAVFNAAAYNQVDVAEKEPLAAYEANALGVRNITLACRQNDARLIHFSTDYVFDGKLAFVEVSRYADKNPYNRPDLTYSDICILSLGTGHYSSVITEKQGIDWGILDWVTNISDIMMQGVNQASDYEGQELAKNAHHLRLQVDIKDLKYDDLTDSSAATRDYLLNEVNNQIFSNPTTMDAFKKYIIDADLGRGRS